MSDQQIGYALDSAWYGTGEYTSFMRDRLSKLTLNQQVPADGWTTGERGFTWWRLPSGGWVRSDVVNENGACDQLPIE